MQIRQCDEYKASHIDTSNPGDLEGEPTQLSSCLEPLRIAQTCCVEVAAVNDSLVNSELICKVLLEQCRELDITSHRADSVADITKEDIFWAGEGCSQDRCTLQNSLDQIVIILLYGMVF